MNEEFLRHLFKAEAMLIESARELEAASEAPYSDDNFGISAQGRAVGAFDEADKNVEIIKSTISLYIKLHSK